MILDSDWQILVKIVQTLIVFTKIVGPMFSIITGIYLQIIYSYLLIKICLTQWVVGETLYEYQLKLMAKQQLTGVYFMESMVYIRIYNRYLLIPRSHINKTCLRSTWY